MEAKEAKKTLIISIVWFVLLSIINYAIARCYGFLILPLSSLDVLGLVITEVFILIGTFFLIRK